MNQHISLEITNEILATKNFVSSCKMAATKDDGKVDKAEQKMLDKISKLSVKYMKELEKLAKK